MKPYCKVFSKSVNNSRKKFSRHTPRSINVNLHLAKVNSFSFIKSQFMVHTRASGWKANTDTFSIVVLPTIWLFILKTVWNSLFLLFLPTQPLLLSLISVSFCLSVCLFFPLSRCLLHSSVFQRQCCWYTSATRWVKQSMCSRFYHYYTMWPSWLQRRL